MKSTTSLEQQQQQKREEIQKRKFKIYTTTKMSKFLETKETNVKSKFSALHLTSFSGGKLHFI
jgi:hypothetical protein